MSVAVVTGANRGIGLELCRQLVDRGERVIALCRRPSPELERLRVQIHPNVDVSDIASVQAVLPQIEGKIGLLINNAGILRDESLSDLNLETIQEQFTVNALGPLAVTRALLPKLGQNAKVALITSRMGSIEDNTSGGRYGYRMSKAALNMAGVSLAHDLKPRGIAVAILHPGFVQTEMTGNRGNLTTEQSAKGLLARIDGLDLENSGTFWHSNGEVLPW